MRILWFMTDRLLPAVPGVFALDPAEGFWNGVARLSVEQLTTVVKGLQGDLAFDEAVHEARKATKRLRALLRLVRPTLGEGVYRRENRLLREASRALAPLRDDRVMVTTLIDLRNRYNRLLAESVFGEVEQRLTTRAERSAQAVIESGAVESAMATFEEALDRYRRWSPAPAAAVPIGDGVGAIYRRGRDEMVIALATGDPHDMHAWRKRVKYLRHQLEVIAPVFPEVLVGTAAAMERLGDVLGLDHDLVELAGLIEQNPHLCPDRLERSLLIGLLRHRRSELLEVATVAGHRLFAERPEAFSRRIGLYWAAGELGGR